MSKVTVTPITNANNLSNINNNFASLAAELNDKVLYRANPVGEANQMANTLDMNGNPIINVSSIDSAQIKVNGVDVVGAVNSAAASAASSAASAQGSATASDNSSASAAVSAANAASTLANALVKTNNLSDLTSVSTAKVNLVLVKADVGLGNVDNTSDVNKPVSTAQATAIALKANAANAALTGTTTAAAITATGLISPSSTVGIKGTVAVDNAQAGSIGEYLTASASGVSLTSATAANITSISLTAGDWDVEGTVVFANAATTVASSATASISSTTGTIDFSTGRYSQLNSSTPGNAVTALPSPNVRINVSVTTVIFLVGLTNFSTSTMTANGLIRARRIR